ncbi:hypothetical protein JM98_01213, partial [Treponema putidum]
MLVNAVSITVSGVARKSILLKTADNEGMEIENIFDYFNDIKIIS